MSWRERRRNSLFLSPTPRSPDPDDLPWHCQADGRRGHLFWGDERRVPPDHAESNYRMVQEALLSRISIPPENIHRMAGEKEPHVAANEYEEELRRFFALAPYGLAFSRRRGAQSK